MGCCSSVSDSDVSRLRLQLDNVADSNDANKKTTAVSKKSVEIMLSGMTPSALVSKFKQSLIGCVPDHVVVLPNTLEQSILDYITGVMEIYIRYEGSNSNAMRMSYGDRAFLPTVLYRLSGLCRTEFSKIGDISFLCDFLLCVVDYFRFSKQKKNGSPYLLENPSTEDFSDSTARHFNACRQLVSSSESTNDSIYITPGVVIVAELALWCINMAKPNFFSNALLESTDSTTFHFSALWDSISEVFTVISSSKTHKFCSSASTPGFPLKRKSLGVCVSTVLSRMIMPISI